MIFHRDPKKSFAHAKHLFDLADFNEAAKSFQRSWNAQRSEKSLSYLMLTHLLRSDFKSIARLMNEREFYGGFSWYTLFWCRFLTGDFYELDDILDTMLECDNYFVRAFALYEIIKRRKSREHRANAGRYLHQAGLSYEMPIEEYRASLYTELIHERYDSALSEVRKLIIEFPRQPEVYIDLFEVMNRTGDKELLKELIYDKAVQTHARNDYRLMYLISRAFYSAGDTENAKLALKTLTGLFRSNPVFYYNLGNIYFRQRNFGSAVEHYKKAIEFAPLFERAHFNLGTLYLKAGYLIDAERSLEEAVRLRKKPDNLNNLTACYISGKRLEDAYEFLQSLSNVDRGFRERSIELKNQIKQVLVLT
ncbi:MAG: tetratricopeptide repeat protein [Brevinematales bacterium]|nr:tetratricopeptide repeat protein [Brevinematales bacterium]